MVDSSRKIRVVIVDDDPAIIEVVTHVIGEDPRIQLVGTGRNGRQALQLANSLRPDVMLLDVRMPLLNGIEAAARISRVFPSIALVILTSEDSVDIVKEALRAGVREFLNKTTDMIRVADRIVEAEGKRDPLAPSRGLATVWSFHGVKESAGCTTLALSCASDLASIGFRVLLAEFDFQGSDLSVYLKLAPRPREDTLLACLESESQISSDQSRRCIRPCRLTDQSTVEFDLLESPDGLVRLPHGVEERIAVLFDLYVTMYDYIVVDLPPGRLLEPHSVPLLDLSERLFLVTHNEPSCLTRLTSTAKSLQDMEYPFDKLTLLVSHLVAQPHLDAKAWLEERMPSLGDLVEVPVDVDACAASISKGVSVQIHDPGSVLAQFVRSFVDRALNRVSSVPRKSNLWQALKRCFRL